VVGNWTTGRRRYCGNVTRNDKDTNHNEQLERKTRQRPETQTSFAEIGAKNDQNRTELFNSIRRLLTVRISVHSIEIVELTLCENCVIRLIMVVMGDAFATDARRLTVHQANKLKVKARFREAGPSR
jgi:hypothetical protein